MVNKMLIDAAHPEETRVVVLRGNRIEEFDFESASRKQLRGNIYLAKVTRVEPSLQAAFVDYGGNRHGFLAFSEIHPDYYQIPVADRQALLQQEAADDIADQASEEAEDDAAVDDDSSDDDGEDQTDADAAEAENGDAPGEDDLHNSAEISLDDDSDNGSLEADDVESVGEEDALAEVQVRRRVRERRYKIQEVIKRRQIILVQVVKEERGTKGAALTSYLSLAGRYCVLMPNTARGGGISRKITHAADRKRLKNVAESLNVPEGTGLIVRTAGAKRTKAEIKRDFEYLLRLWEKVRDLTLDSSAPALVYEEGSLIKRSIRDLYNKDIDEIIVEGEEGYKEAKSFMRMLMPSHAKNVQVYKDNNPLFIRNQIESQLDGMFQSRVTLKSGGYLIINPTEALVSIDVNSGRSTREHNIEDTALNTNLEAAEETARQLRLRDLAGLVVIDFIDMEERRNNRAVERRMKDCLKRDRARIQVGRISHFGLLEMSRQRMRAGVVEGSTQPCPHCAGVGLVRSVESSSLFVLRSIEEHILKGKAEDLVVRAPQEVALYILNQKRSHLLSIEERHEVSLLIEAGEGLIGTDIEISGGSGKSTTDAVGRRKASAAADTHEPAAAEDDENKGKRKRRRRRRGRRSETQQADHNNSDVAAEAETEPTSPTELTDDGASAADDDNRKKKTSRGRRGSRRRKSEDNAAASPAQAPVEVAMSDDQATEVEAASPESVEEDKPKRRSRRRSANGRGRAENGNQRESASDAPGDAPQDNDRSDDRAGEDNRQDTAATSADAPQISESESDAPKRRRRTRKSKTDGDTAIAAGENDTDQVTTEDKSPGDEDEKPKRARRPRARKKAAPTDNGAQADEENNSEATPPPEPEPTVIPEPPAPAGPPRSGWWQRR